MAQKKDANKRRDLAQELRDEVEVLKAAKRGEVKLRQRTFVNKDKGSNNTPSGQSRRGV